jgi:bifunctional UDP-N-acetylglucosamine pyrophosphorylase/glucosamine-1-phosphate N-acetyltransferase
MQAVILAAGKGTRMLPFTHTTPKPLIRVAGEPILTHIMRELPETIDEIILVVGYLGEKIIEYYGDVFEGKQLTYVWQKHATGTADALNLTRPYIHGTFLLLLGDDLVGRESLQFAIQHTLAVLAYEHNEPQHFGVIIPDEDDNLVEIIEKPENPPSNLINTGSMVLDERIFEIIQPTPSDHENWLTWYITDLAKERPIKIIRQQYWYPIGKPEDIPIVETFLNSQQ